MGVEIAVAVFFKSRPWMQMLRTPASSGRNSTVPTGGCGSSVVNNSEAVSSDNNNRTASSGLWRLRLCPHLYARADRIWRPTGEGRAPVISDCDDGPTDAWNRFQAGRPLPTSPPKLCPAYSNPIRAKKVSIQFDSIRQSDKFAACTLIFKYSKLGVFL